MTTTLAVLGMQYGDEGKGKIIDFLAEKADVIARFNGGNNAGHTLRVKNKQVILHLIPSGILHKGKLNIIGNGVVVDPQILMQELDDLAMMGIKVTPENFMVSENAHIILQEHIDEDKMKHAHIGTTSRGIGPAYMDKAERTGLRVSRYVNKNKEFSDQLKPFVKDTSLVINNLLNEKKKVLFEGAQGTLLDIDHGTYPFVTSSSSTIGGVCTGLGVGTKKIENSIGVLKAYVTRVGTGPFTTELNDNYGAYIQKKGKEIGATTGRRRRVGWFDALIGKYSVMINGFDAFVMTKVDVLSGIDKIKICTSYKHEGNVIKKFTTRLDILENCEPIYEEMKGWKEDISKITNFDKLPKNAIKYIRRIEELLGIPMCILSLIYSG